MYLYAISEISENRKYKIGNFENKDNLLEIPEDKILKFLEFNGIIPKFFKKMDIISYSPKGSKKQLFVDYKFNPYLEITLIGE